MQITSYPVYTVNPYKPDFRGIKINRILKDVFQKSADKGLQEMKGIRAGVYGTQCKGSKPLKDFFETFETPENKNIQALFDKGQSTNTRGCAYSFLKTCADNPISTCEVRDCSVMYLYNKEKNTHYLYHIYKDNNFDEIDYLIKTCMPEGYSDAIIVPGASFFEAAHKKYLPDIFKAIQHNNPNAEINVYHYSSELPEVVFLKGNAYEIPNMLPWQYGQTHFKIADYRTYTTLHDVGKCKTLEELNNLNGKVKLRKIDKEIRKILQNMITERKAMISKIHACKTVKELDIVAKETGCEYEKLPVTDPLGCRGYFDIIKKQSLKIAGQN